MKQQYDVVIIGAGAAGLMCAARAGYRGKSVLLLDHANKPGKKILMSGGGRCNFTNLNCSEANFFSRNPPFCISALRRYSPRDFVELVERHGIEYVEKAPGQLFCKDSAKDILNMLLTECEWAGVELSLNTRVESVVALGDGCQLLTSAGKLSCGKLVVATGGLSIPTMGASGFGYDIARQFDLPVIDTHPTLVPFILTSHWKQRAEALAGVAADVSVSVAKNSHRTARYSEPMLFTHRGLSGPSMLQISSWWQPGEALEIDFAPTLSMASLIEMRQTTPKKQLQTLLSELLPKRLALALLEWQERSPDECLADVSNASLQQLLDGVKRLSIKPAGTEGYRTAEVTMGGVDTSAISQQDFSVKSVPQLAFIGEVLDVTGELGGHNFQWAWACAVACAEGL